MAVFLFWNLNNKPLKDSIVRLAVRYEIDVLIFVEMAIRPEVLLTALNRENSFPYHYAPGIGCEKIHIFTRFADQLIRPIYEESRLTIRHLTLPAQAKILLVAVHFPSKLCWTDDSQAAECGELARAIREAEEQAGHSRTVVVGDLNMNPFETGVVSASGLHAVMSRSIAQKKTRLINDRPYPFFYNPMWSLFGDASPGPPGTYYYCRAEHKVFFWNMFDQVLIRPDLLKSFDNNDLKILDSDGNTSFLSSRGVPNQKSGSDHLPILFKIKL